MGAFAVVTACNPAYIQPSVVRFHSQAEFFQLLHFKLNFSFEDAVRWRMAESLFSHDESSVEASSENFFLWSFWLQTETNSTQSRIPIEGSGLGGPQGQESAQNFTGNTMKTTRGVTLVETFREN